MSLGYCFRCEILWHAFQVFQKLDSDCRWDSVAVNLRFEDLLSRGWNGGEVLLLWVTSDSVEDSAIGVALVEVVVGWGVVTVVTERFIVKNSQYSFY